MFEKIKTIVVINKTFPDMEFESFALTCTEIKDNC